MKEQVDRTLAISLCLILAVTAGAKVCYGGDDAAGPPAAESAPGVHVLVAYYSRTGNTEKLARAAGAGAAKVPGVTTSVKSVDTITKEDLTAADGIVLGAPTYFANLPGAMKLVIDDWNWKMKVDFTDKVGGAFSTGGGRMGGKEHAVVSLLLYMINNRMIVAGPLYSDEEGEDKWAEIGGGAITGPLDPGVGETELDNARRIGHGAAHLVKKLAGQ